MLIRVFAVLLFALNLLRRNSRRERSVLRKLSIIEVACSCVDKLTDCIETGLLRRSVAFFCAFAVIRAVAKFLASSFRAWVKLPRCDNGPPVVIVKIPIGRQKGCSPVGKYALSRRCLIS